MTSSSRQLIRDRLDALPPPKRAQLLYALQHELAQYVRVGESDFIGVNVAGIANLSIQEQTGPWAIGKVR